MIGMCDFAKRTKVTQMHHIKRGTDGTEAGDCYTGQEVTEMLSSAGFATISRIEFESGLSQVIAQKTV